MQVFKGSGNGGQKKQKTSSGVRLIHHESGARAEASDNRSQYQNKKSAFLKLIETKEFKVWHRCETARRMGGPSIAKLVEEAMRPENLRYEVRSEKGQWVLAPQEWEGPRE